MSIARCHHDVLETYCLNCKEEREERLATRRREQLEKNRLRRELFG